MKRSIVLLITLGLILTLSALLYISLDTVDRTQKEAIQKRLFIQKSIFVQEIIKILKKKKDQIDSAQGVALLTSLPITLKSDNIGISVTFTSAAYGLNPNNLLQHEGKKSFIDPNYILLFDRILQYYHVQNKELFLAMLEDTLDADLEERMPGSEIALYNRRFVQGSIESEKKFDMILQAYIKQSEDDNIKKVPWKELLTFHNAEIDINYISPVLLRFMLPTIDPDTIARLTTQRRNLYESMDDLPLPKDEKERLKRYRVTTYTGIVEGRLRIEPFPNKNEALFIYDIDQKKVLEIAIF